MNAGVSLVMEIGVLLGYDNSIEDYLKWCVENELFTCQLSVSPDAHSSDTAKNIKALFDKYNIRITALVGGWSGPQEWNFSGGPDTLGIVPQAYRAMRMRELESHARFAVMLGVQDVCTHMGFIPENPSDRTYTEFITALRFLAGYYKNRGIFLNMETGQETPVVLLRVINDVQTDNVGINFDPANLLMYGKANPIDALSIIGSYVRGVHAKDGEYPTDGICLGVEKPLGEGRVDIELFIKTLHKIGYNGAITIEREISGQQQKNDVASAGKLLRKIINEL